MDVYKLWIYIFHGYTAAAGITKPVSIPKLKRFIFVQMSFILKKMAGA